MLLGRRARRGGGREGEGGGGGGRMCCVDKTCVIIYASEMITVMPEVVRSEKMMIPGVLDT